MMKRLSLLLQSLKSIVRSVRKSQPTANITEDLTAGSELIILGNGPSLKADLLADPAFFQSKACLCVNDFPKTELFRRLKPRYLLFVDSAYWIADAAPKHLRVREEISRGISEVCDWPLLILVPLEAKGLLPKDLFPGKANVRLMYFNNTPIWGVSSITRLLVRKGLGMIPAYNVLAAAIQIGLRLGYGQIYLFGADHSWHRDLWLNENGILCIKENHFYADEDRLTPLYRDAAQTRTWKVDEVFRRYSDVFASYAEIGKLADAMSVKVTNGSSITFIDAFPRLPRKT